MQVPDSVREAAVAFGASPRQLLFKVEIPLAIPSIMTGINQSIMMSLSMVVVAAFDRGRRVGIRRVVRPSACGEPETAF